MKTTDEEHYRIPRWLWAVLVVAVGWVIRVEVQLATVSTTRELTREVRGLRDDVIELKVEVQHVKTQLGSGKDARK